VQILWTAKHTDLIGLQLSAFMKSYFDVANVLKRPFNWQMFSGKKLENRKPHIVAD